MVKIGYKVLLAADVWTYATRTLTSHKFPFTNPDSVVDLSNVQTALSGTPATGRVAKIDNLDIKVSSVWEKLMTDLKIDVFANCFIAKEGADITPSVLAYQTGDTYDNIIHALIAKKGATLGEYAIQIKDLGADYAKISLIAEIRVHNEAAFFFSYDGTVDNKYFFAISPYAPTKDIRIFKTVGGVETEIATITEDINDLQRVKVKIDLDLGNDFLAFSVFNPVSGEWRGVHVYDTTFATVRYIGVRVHPANTTNIFFYPIIILYE